VSIQAAKQNRDHPAEAAPLKNRTQELPPGRKMQNTHRSAPLAIRTRSVQPASSPACNAHPSARRPFALGFPEHLIMAPDLHVGRSGEREVRPAVARGAAKIIADETRWSHRLLAVMMDGLIAIDVATSLDLKP